MEKAMRITDLLSAADVILDLNAGSKRSLLQTLAAEAANRFGHQEQVVLDALLARERLGSTALGRGVALPHARLEGDALPAMLCLRLRHPIDYEARDDEPVDLVFLMLWPEASPEGFLPALSEICRALRDPQVLRRLRLAGRAEEVVALMHQGGSATPGRSSAAEQE
jgi:PTS system nitrogen regulatory IIA component